MPPPCPFASPLRATKAWDRPRLPHLVHINELLDKSDLRIWCGRTSSRAFMTCRLGYWTSNYGLHWCRDQRTFMANVGHLGQEPSGKSAILGDNSTGNYLLPVHGVILGLGSVERYTGRRHQAGCLRCTAIDIAACVLSSRV